MRSERALEAQYRPSTAQPKNTTSLGRFAVLVSSCPSWLMFAPDAVIDSQKTIQANVRKKCCQADYSSRQEEDDRDIGLNTLLMEVADETFCPRCALLPPVRYGAQTEWNSANAQPVTCIQVLALAI